MNYLITGATGFIGRHLVKMLLSGGHTVNYFGRKRSPLIDPRAAFFNWNVNEEPPLECVCRPDAIVHLAGEPIAQRWNAEVKRCLYDSRVESTRNLVAAIAKLKYKPSVLVSGSAIGYYGERGGEVLTEDSAPGTGFISNLCVKWEREAMKAVDFGVRVVPVRTSVVLGRDGGAVKQMAAPFRFGVGGKLGSGRQWMSWIHISDMIRLLVFAANEPSLTSPVNGCSPTPVTNAEFTDELAQTLHRPALFSVPQFALRLIMGEVANHVFESIRVLPEAAERHGFDFQYPSLPAALENVLGRPV
jgi:uncharacterized protein (TIGR01777 family)